MLASTFYKCIMILEKAGAIHHSFFTVVQPYKSCSIGAYANNGESDYYLLVYKQNYCLV